VLSRIIQSLIPVFLTPLVLWTVNNLGADKAPILLIPWLVFCVVYVLVFNVLFKCLTSKAILFVVAVPVSIIASYVLALALFYFVFQQSGA
jgi:hypothetical protein